MMANRYYFAYGSNMLKERLEDRVGKVISIGVYVLKGWKLEFNCGYKGANFSYANIVFTGDKKDFVEGVLYELTWRQECILNEYEKLYRVETIRDKSYKKDIFAYTAYWQFVIKPSQKNIPFLWYINLLLDGCLQNGLTYTYNELLNYKLKHYKLSKGSRHKPF